MGVVVAGEGSLPVISVTDSEAIWPKHTVRIAAYEIISIELSRKT